MRLGVYNGHGESAAASYRAPVAASGAPRAAGESATVIAECGHIQGVRAGSVNVFRGIPYAAPPLGARRFAPPVAAAPFTETFDAAAFGPIAPQDIDPLPEVVPGTENLFYASGVSTDEDCLNLNVWSPSGAQRAPVLVYVHGGGFLCGSGTGPWFDGTAHAREHGLVVVTLNYRLGILGGLYLGAYEPTHANLGLQDQLLALAWVKANIAAFGGDPDNVTVAGESAGAMSVAAMLFAPAAQGLFARAVVESGHLDGALSVAEARAATRRVLAELHIAPDAPDAPDVLARLRETSLLRILAVQRRLGIAARLFPLVDDDLVLTGILAPDGMPEWAHGVDLLVGTTLEENRLFTLTGWGSAPQSPELTIARLLEDPGDRAAALGLYGPDAGPDADPVALSHRIVTERAWSEPARRLGIAHAEHRRPHLPLRVRLALERAGRPRGRDARGRHPVLLRKPRRPGRRGAARWPRARAGDPGAGPAHERHPGAVHRHGRPRRQPAGQVGALHRPPARDDGDRRRARRRARSCGPAARLLAGAPRLGGRHVGRRRRRPGMTEVSGAIQVPGPTEAPGMPEAPGATEVAQPLYEPAGLKVGIVHLGVGNFHRAHQAMYVDRMLNQGLAGDWAICGVGLTPADVTVRDVLEAQGMRYTLVERHPDGSMEARSIASIVDILYAPEDPEAAIERLADPQTRMVTLTITEGGYNITDSTGEFDTEKDWIRRDVERGVAPETVFGIVVEALRRRRQRGVLPFTVVSCDNLPGNGAIACRSFSGFASLRDPELGDWIRAEVPFPNSMVDRITPATTDAERRLVFDTFGVRDAWPVVCEDFTQWVLEDRFSLGRPPLEAVACRSWPTWSRTRR